MDSRQPRTGRPPGGRSSGPPWGQIAGADFFTIEVWTARGLVTYSTRFVIDLRSRRGHVAGSTPTPDAGFMAQVALTDAVDGFLAGHRFLICDRDRQWTEGFRRTILRVLDEFVTHSRWERNHQGLGNELIMPETRPLGGTRVRCRARLGGLLRYYHRAA